MPDLDSASKFIQENGLATFFLVLSMGVNFLLIKFCLSLSKNVERLAVMLAVHMKLERASDEHDPRVSSILDRAISAVALGEKKPKSEKKSARGGER